ncbi:MAG: hypothetical protein N2508_09735 [Anaerolineae bacterium]|nr:hypothetical protein [Anaerolineae bacterium]
MSDWMALLWLAVTLALLVLMDRWIHRHLQGIMLLLTGDAELAAVLYALPLLPGILLHELSHALAATLLGVRVGRISIRPRRTGQRIQLGFVPVEKTDVVRASLIGLAPLLAGSGAILLIGHLVLDVGALSRAFADGKFQTVLAELARALRGRDAWLWAYLIFAIGNTMLPSRSDREAWTPVLLFLILVGVLVWLSGFGATVVGQVAGPVGEALRWLTVACALTVAADVPFALLMFLTEKLLERLRGMQVQY